MAMKVPVYFELADDLMGVRYWVQYYQQEHPRYEIYEYIGCNAESDKYFFQSRDRKNTIFKTFDQLNTEYFKPFLLNFELIEKRIKELGGQK